MGAQRFNFALEFSQNSGFFSAPKFALWMNIFRQEDIVIIFATAENLGWASALPHHLLPIRRLSPWALGTCPHLDSHRPHGQLWRAGVELPGLLSPLILPNLSA